MISDRLLFRVLFFILILDIVFYLLYIVFQLDYDLIINYSYVSFFVGVVGLSLFIINLFFKRRNLWNLLLSILLILYVLLITIDVYSKLH
ncbi:hypothetical protein D7036_24495 [Aquimarina sp. BL5]|nr:hypothetical protein D7036_24495 [Aquimarina sp. BL5]